jgi:hypothetical protein
MARNLSSELQQFYSFLGERLANGGARISPEEALDEWRAENPSKEMLDESIAAIKKALEDMEAGDTGRPAEEVVADLRRKYHLASEQ